jgi:hypothetical protein
MHVEDSKHRVYIRDLDEELAGTEPDEERLVFLPDIEKKLANLPKSVFVSEPAPQGNEVVLYRVPESLSVPPEQDNVRKAIIESRARAQEKKLNGPHDEMSQIHQQPWDERDRGALSPANHIQRDEWNEDDMDLGG